MSEAQRSNAPLVGVVTVLFNSDAFLDDFVAGLAAQHDVRLRLYAIDNSPTSDGLTRLRELALEHGIPGEFVANAENVGIARGNNQGIALALRDACSHVLLANNDIAFAADTLAPLLTHVRDWRRAATPHILYADSGETWYAGGEVRPWTARVLHAETSPSATAPAAIPTQYASTCFLLVHADVFAHVGRMDEAYFVYYDDVDFALRCGAAGVEIVVVPSSRVAHKVGGSTAGARSPFTAFHANRSRVYFIRKHFRGLRFVTAMAYTLATRALRLVSAPAAERRATWAGLVAGFALAFGRGGRSSTP